MYSVVIDGFCDFCWNLFVLFFLFYLPFPFDVVRYRSITKFIAEELKKNNNIRSTLLTCVQ